MKNCLFTLVIAFLPMLNYSQTPYDSFAPEQKSKKIIELKSQRFVVENPEKSGDLARVLFDEDKSLMTYCDVKDSILAVVRLKPTDIKFLSIDRFAEKYYSLSPYQFVAGNPIRNIDINGDSIWSTITTPVTGSNGQSTIQSTNYYYGQDASGTWGFVDPTGNLYSGNNQFLNNLTSALNSVQNGGAAGNALITGLAGSSNNVMILQSRGGNREFQDANYPQYDSYVKWNPNSNSPFQGQNYVSLIHELAHTQDRFNGTLNMNTWFNTANQAGNNVSIPYAEIYSTHIENQIRAEHNLPLRTHYTIDAFGNGVGPRLIYNNTRQSRYYNANSVPNPNYRTVGRRASYPYIY